MVSPWDLLGEVAPLVGKDQTSFLNPHSESFIEGQDLRPVASSDLKSWYDLVLNSRPPGQTATVINRESNRESDREKE